MILEQLPNVQELTREQKLLLASELWDEASPSPSEEQCAAIQELVKARMAAWRDDPSQAISLAEFNERFSTLRHRG